METKITNKEIEILSPFFEDPKRKFYIRELSRILKINHITVSQKLNKLVKEGFLLKEESNITTSYSVVISRKYINLKLYYNLEKLRISNILEDIQKAYDYPVIVLFGGYAFSMDYSDSDIDLCVITDINKEFDTKKYEKILNRPVSIHKFSKKEWQISIKKHTQLINNICNGIVLSGQLEVLK